MQIHAPAKLNLCLYLGARRGDGLHELCSLFEPLALGGFGAVREVIELILKSQDRWDDLIKDFIQPRINTD